MAKSGGNLFGRDDYLTLHNRPTKKKKFGRDKSIPRGQLAIRSENPLRYRRAQSGWDYPSKVSKHVPCVVEGCTKHSAVYRTYCTTHLTRLVKHGDPIKGRAVRKWVIKEAIRITKHLLAEHVPVEKQAEYLKTANEIIPSLTRPKAWCPTMADWSIDIYAKEQSKVGLALLWHKPVYFYMTGYRPPPECAARFNLFNTIVCEGIVGSRYALVSSEEFHESRISAVVGQMLHKSMDRTWPDPSAANGKIEFKLTDKACRYVGAEYLAKAREVYGKSFWEQEATLPSGRVLTFREFLHETLNRIFEIHQIKKYNPNNDRERQSYERLFKS